MLKPLIAEPFARHELRDRLAFTQEYVDEYLREHPALQSEDPLDGLDVQTEYASMIHDIETANSLLARAASRLEHIEEHYAPHAPDHKDA